MACILLCITSAVGMLIFHTSYGHRDLFTLVSSAVRYSVFCFLIMWTTVSVGVKKVALFKCLVFSVIEDGIGNGTLRRQVVFIILFLFSIIPGILDIFTFFQNFLLL